MLIIWIAVVWNQVHKSLQRNPETPELHQDLNYVVIQEFNNSDSFVQI